MSVRSDALFQDAKAQLMEIKSQQSKRADQRVDVKIKKKKRKQKA